MKVKLNELNAEATHVCVEENDVFVNLDYQEIDESLVKFFLYAYVGKDKNKYRLCIKTIYMVDLEKDEFVNHDDFVSEVLNRIIEPLIETIIMLDKTIISQEERCH